MHLGSQGLGAAPSPSGHLQAWLTGSQQAAEYWPKVTVTTTCPSPAPSTPLDPLHLPPSTNSKGSIGHWGPASCPGAVAGWHPSWRSASGLCRVHQLCRMQGTGQLCLLGASAFPPLLSSALFFYPSLSLPPLLLPLSAPHLLLLPGVTLRNTYPRAVIHLASSLRKEVLQPLLPKSQIPTSSPDARCPFPLHRPPPNFLAAAAAQAGHCGSCCMGGGFSQNLWVCGSAPLNAASTSLWWNLLAQFLIFLPPPSLTYSLFICQFLTMSQALSSTRDAHLTLALAQTLLAEAQSLRSLRMWSLLPLMSSQFLGGRGVDH